MPPTYTISKTFTFSASHQLDHLPPTHQCARLHGHNYTVCVTLCSDRLDENGFVLDFGEMAPFKHFIDTKLDHRHLNEVLGSSKATTAENLADYLYHQAQIILRAQVLSVAVYETDKTMAVYSEQ